MKRCRHLARESMGMGQVKLFKGKCLEWWKTELTCSNLSIFFYLVRTVIQSAGSSLTIHRTRSDIKQQKGRLRSKHVALSLESSNSSATTLLLSVQFAEEIISTELTA